MCLSLRLLSYRSFKIIWLAQNNPDRKLQCQIREIILLSRGTTLMKNWWSKKDLSHLKSVSRCVFQRGFYLLRKGCRKWSSHTHYANNASKTNDYSKKRFHIKILLFNFLKFFYTITKEKNKSPKILIIFLFFFGPMLISLEIYWPVKLLFTQ